MGVDWAVMDIHAEPLVMKAVSGALAARQWLQSARQPAVMHVFDRAVNLLDPEAGVLSLVPHQLGAGPFTVVVEGVRSPFGPEGRFTEWLTADSPVRVEARRLVAGRLAVGTAGMAIWDPALPWEGLRSGRHRLLAARRLWTDLLLDEAPPGGLAELVQRRTSGGSKTGGLDRALIERAQGPARKLVRALAAQDEAEAARAAASLAGLGQGLTPSGDDFILGAMYAIRLGDDVDWAVRASHELAGASGPRTTRLSRAWLEAGAKGEASLAWHRLLEAALGGEPGEIESTTRSLLAVGHTSGADALAGFLVTLDALNPEGAVRL